MHWITKGRPAIAVFAPSTKHSITHSQLMISTCANKPLLWVIEQLIEIPFLGGITGPQQKVELFLCLVFRLLQIQPPPPIILEMLQQDAHKYLRVGAMMFIRLLGSVPLLREAREVGLNDYRKIRVYGNINDLTGSPPTGILPIQLQQQQKLFGGKRSRDESEKNCSEESKSSSANTDMLSSTHYFVTHVDEIACCLFGSGGDGIVSENEFFGLPTHFLGIPLPSIDHMSQ